MVVLQSITSQSDLNDTLSRLYKCECGDHSLLPLKNEKSDLEKPVFDWLLEARVPRHYGHHPKCCPSSDAERVAEGMQIHTEVDHFIEGHQIWATWRHQIRYNPRRPIGDEDGGNNEDDMVRLKKQKSP